jgi:Protein of unknown function VcgC/VcgE (DUF2780)
VLHKHMTIVLTVFSAGLALLLSAPTGAHAAGLVDLLTQQLGVTEAQATGGAGAIFTMAKSKLSPQDFGQVAKAVPNMADLLQAAPKVEGLGGATGSSPNSAAGGSVGGMLGSKPTAAAGTLGGLSSLSGAFSQLGLSSDMIGKFVPIVLQFAESQGGATVKNLLAGVLQ